MPAGNMETGDQDVLAWAVGKQFGLSFRYSPEEITDYWPAKRVPSKDSDQTELMSMLNWFLIRGTCPKAHNIIQSQPKVCISD